MRVLWFLVYVLKYVLVAVVGGAVLGVIFPPVGGGLFLLLLIGGFVAAWTDSGERCRRHEQQGEIEGFDQALRSMQQELRQS